MINNDGKMVVAMVNDNKNNEIRRMIVALITAKKNNQIRYEKNFDVLSKTANLDGKQIKLYGIYSKPDKQGRRTEIQPCRYVRVHGFHNGTAMVEYLNYDSSIKFGFINEKGEEVIRCVYDDACSDIIKGFHKVGKRTKNGKMLYGYVDNQNQPVVTFAYNSCEATNVLIEHLKIKDYEKRVNVD